MNRPQEPNDKFRLKHLTGAEKAEMSIMPDSPVVTPEKLEARRSAYRRAIGITEYKSSPDE